MQQPNERGGGGGVPRRVHDRAATCYVCRRPAHMYDGWVYLWRAAVLLGVCASG